MVLVRASPDLTLHFNDKTVLFLALDGKIPLQLLTYLLESHPSPQQWVNDECNILQARNDHCYSATAYLRYHLCQAPQLRTSTCCERSDCTARPLKQVLSSFKCRERFWDSEGGPNQPEGACGLPDWLSETLESEQAKRREEEEKCRILAHELELQDIRLARRRVEAETDINIENRRAAAERQRMSQTLDLLKEQEKIQMDGLKARARIRHDEMNQKQNLLKEMRTTVAQLQLNPRAQGMILGEMSDNQRFLTGS